MAFRPKKVSFIAIVLSLSLLYTVGPTLDLHMRRLIKHIAKLVAVTTGNNSRAPQALMAKFTLVASEMDGQWNDCALQKLIDIQHEAREAGHCFVQLHFLLEMAKSLIETDGGRERFGQVLERIYAMDDLFSMDDDEFRAWYVERHPALSSPVASLLLTKSYVDLFNFYNGRADYMSAHLYSDIAVLCGKAALKIVGLMGKVPFEEVAETCFMIAVNYGNLRDAKSAMWYYDKVAAMASSRGDATYEFIALSRKLSIAIQSMHFDPYLSLDKERAEAMRSLFALADRLGVSLSGLGGRLLEDEKSRKGKMAQYRIDRLMEAVPVMPLMLALSRGDIATAQKYTERLKESERKAYGSVEGYSNADAMLRMYLWLYSSPDRDEAYEANIEQMEHCDGEEDVEHDADLPEEMFKSDKFRKLIGYAHEELRCGHYVGAGSFAMQALEVASGVYSVYHEAMAACTMGQRHECAGDVDAAIGMYNTALNMLFTSDSHTTDSHKSSYLYYVALFAMGKLERNTNPDTAIALLTAALNYDDVSVLYKAKILQARAEAYACKGEWELGCDDCLQALQLTLDDIKVRVPIIETEAREKLWAAAQTNVEQSVALFTAMRSSPLASKQSLSALYNAVLCCKGALLSSEHSLKQTVYTEEALRHCIPLYEKLQLRHDTMRKWGTSTDGTADEYIEYYADEMRLQLAISEHVGKHFKFMDMTLADIQQAMSPQAVVVDFFDYPTADDDKQYVAFVFRKNDQLPKLIALCKESNLQKVIDEIGEGRDAKNRMYDDHQPFAKKIKELLWDEVEVACNITCANEVYFVPTGSLHKIALESLPGHSEGMTMLDSYKVFSRLSTSRGLMNEAECALDDIALYGGLYYGGDMDEEDAIERGYTVNRRPGASLIKEWRQLPMTEKEVDSIALLFKSKGSGSVVVKKGYDGTTDDFMSLSDNNPSILHLATHGFFESSHTIVPALKGCYRPMDLSGMVLSNGNEGWVYGSKDNHEGVITAAEISRMNLGQTRLAVLSACYTGEGIVRADGVFGLQRGLKKAGVGSILLCLWTEYDGPGCFFMTEFYSRLFDRNYSIREAFVDAKKELRNRYKDPAIWAGYLLID